MPLLGKVCVVGVEQNRSWAAASAAGIRLHDDLSISTSDELAMRLAMASTSLCGLADVSRHTSALPDIWRALCTLAAGIGALGGIQSRQTQPTPADANLMMTWRVGGPDGAAAGAGSVRRDTPRKKRDTNCESDQCFVKSVKHISLLMKQKGTMWPGQRPVKKTFQASFSERTSCMALP